MRIARVSLVIRPVFVLRGLARYRFICNTQPVEIASLGVISLGVISLGVISLGVISLGVISLGVISLGVISLGVISRVLNGTTRGVCLGRFGVPFVDGGVGGVCLGVVIHHRTHGRRLAGRLLECLPRLLTQLGKFA